MNETTINYTLDLNTGLTQVLVDGTNTYLYGAGRIAQVDDSTADMEYFLGDRRSVIAPTCLMAARSRLGRALGSVRQLTDGEGAVTLTQSYEPYGEVLSSEGEGASIYGFTAEQTDASGLVYLRARYYDGEDGMFLTRDTWGGDYEQPITFNTWLYANNNPNKYNDPSGHCVGAGGHDFPDGSPACNSKKNDPPAYTPPQLPCDGIGGANGTTCNNLNQAVQILYNPNASCGQRFGAGYYIGVVGGSHLAVGVGLTMAVWEAIISTGVACAMNPTCENKVGEVVSRNVMVLGRYDIHPNYLEVADDVGGTAFSVPSEIWDSLTAVEKLALNQQALDEAAANGTNFYLAHGWESAVEGTGFRWELDYLFNLGYTLSPSQRWLIPPP